MGRQGGQSPTRRPFFCAILDSLGIAQCKLQAGNKFILDDKEKLDEKHIMPDYAGKTM